MAITARSACKGMIVPIVTPFTAVGAIDEPALGLQARRLIEAGVDTLFALGTTGEFYGLALDQRRRAVDLVLDAAGGRTPVVVGVTGDSTASTMATLAAVRHPRVAGYVVSTPYFLSYTQAELIDFFHAVAAAVGGPIILYNYPSRYKHRIDIDTVAALVADGTANAIKDTAGDFEYFQQLAQVKKSHPGFAIFESSLKNLAKAAPLDIDGSVQAIGNLLPDECAAMWRQVVAREDSRLAETVAKLWDFHCRIETAGIFIAALKAAMSTRGWCANVTAAPTKPLATEQVEGLRAMLAETYPATQARSKSGASARR
jgi:4-hydroxy-tetrahydrodipicolinate synthase